MAEIYIFGSIVTGKVDSGSDVDILVVEDNPSIEQYPSSWSVYSVARIREIFEQGTLFSWHLYLDALPLNLKTDVGILQELGPPKIYGRIQAVNEIDELIVISRGALRELNNGTPSDIYELGLVGLAIRDIAMAASKFMTGEFCFSKYSPFENECINSPILLEEYKYLIDCRRSTTRGASTVLSESIRLSIIDKSKGILDWCQNIRYTVGGKNEEILKQIGS